MQPPPLPISLLSVREYRFPVWRVLPQDGLKLDVMRPWMGYVLESPYALDEALGLVPQSQAICMALLHLHRYLNTLLLIATGRH